MEMQIFSGGSRADTQVSSFFHESLLEGSDCLLPAIYVLIDRAIGWYSRCEVRIQAGQLQVVWWSGLIKRERCFHPRNILRASPNDGGAAGDWATTNRQAE